MTNSICGNIVVHKTERINHTNNNKKENNLNNNSKSKKDKDATFDKIFERELKKTT